MYILIQTIMFANGRIFDSNLQFTDRPSLFTIYLKCCLSEEMGFPLDEVLRVSEYIGLLASTLTPHPHTPPRGGGGHLRLKNLLSLVRAK